MARTRAPISKWPSRPFYFYAFFLPVNNMSEGRQERGGFVSRLKGPLKSPLSISFFLSRARAIPIRAPVRNYAEDRSFKVRLATSSFNSYSLFRTAASCS